jgi:DNA-binding transcriptional ArsR family regulator
MQTDEKILAALAGRFLTVHELAEAAGVSLRTAHRALARLREAGYTRVATWAKSATRNYPVPVYALGKGDAPKPVARRASDYQRVWRERKKNENIT